MLEVEPAGKSCRMAAGSSRNWHEAVTGAARQHNFSSVR